MDAYSGYNQIKMHQPDEDKTTFTTGRESTATRWGPSDSRMQGLCSSEWLIKSSRTWSGAPRKFTRRYVGENRNHRDHLQHLYKFFNLLRQYKVTQSWEVHIWDSFREVFGIFGHSMRHRGQPRPDICNPKHEVTHLREGGPDVERNPQPIHQLIHGQVHALLPSIKKKWGRLTLEWGTGDNLPRIEERSDFTSSDVKAFFGINAISIHRHLGFSYEWSLGSWRWSHPKADLLHQPLHEQTINQISKAKKTDACFLHHLEEV